MITSLRLVNFKNFADETLRVGPFTVIVGANASGKSNIRDAFRFLHGIGRGYTLAEILGGKVGGGGQSEWASIRGAPNEIVRFERRYHYEWATFSLQVELSLGEEKTFYYIRVGFHPSTGFSVLDEHLRTESAMVYTTTLASHYVTMRVAKEQGNPEWIELSSSQPALPQLLQHPQWSGSDILRDSHSAFQSMRFLELSPEHMREPSLPGATTLNDSGQNLPTVLMGICADPVRKDVLTSWLRELTPTDVKDFQFPSDPSGRIYLRVVESNDRLISSYSASDGTLRFLAMLAALLGTNPAGIYFFEEIDTGIHPNRLWLLLDLIERQTAKGDIQVITTTHSPDMLNFINDETFRHTSVVSRLEDIDGAILRPINSLPNAEKLRKSQGLGRLHSSGWMEDILNLEAWKTEDEEAGE